MRIALASLLLAMTLQLHAAAASIVSVLPAKGTMATYVVAETKRDAANGKDSTDSDTITMTASPDSSFDTIVGNGAIQHKLTVRPWPGGTLDTNGTVVGATFWAQDLNAVISLFSGRGASLTDGAHWTTQPLADTTAVYVPDTTRQRGTAPLLIPLAVRVMKSGNSWRVEGDSTGDQGNGPTELAVATVKTVAVFSADGTFVHGEGSIRYGAPPSIAGSDVLLIFTRSWTVDPSR